MNAPPEPIPQESSLPLADSIATACQRIPPLWPLKNFVAVVGMDANGASAFQRSTGLRGQILIDLSDTAADRYDSEFCPRLWRIDASGKIAYRTRGALAGAELAGSLAELVHPDAKVHGA